MKARMTAALLCAAVAVLMLCGQGNSRAATYSGGILKDSSNGFKITVPGNWNRQAMNNQDSNTHLFVSPDQNVAVGITTYPGSKDPLGRLLSRFQQTAFAGSQQLAEQKTTLNGVKGLVRAYRVQDANGPVIIGAFARNAAGKKYVLWHMIPQNLYDARYPEADAIMNTFAEINAGAKKNTPQQSAGPKARKPKSKSPVAHAAQPSGQSTVPTGSAQENRQKAPLSQGTFSRFKDPVAGLQFDLPSGWSESHPQENILSIRGKGAKELMTVNYQVLDRRNAKYTDLATAGKELYAQLPGLGQYTIANDVQSSIAGMPAHFLDVYINPGDREYAVRYIEIERPEYIALLSLICPKDQHQSFAPIAKRVQTSIAPYSK